MPALDEIETLEKQIHDRLKRIDELKLKRKRSEESAVKLRAAIEAAQTKVTLHNNNRLHMKNEADVVIFEQFTVTLKHLESAKITVDDSQKLLDKANGTMTACDAELAAIDGEIAKARAKLSKYGQLVEVQFPVREAA